jgi:superkiller protein 3
VTQASLEAALALDPMLCEAHDNLGAVHANSQRQEQAVGHFRLALDANAMYTPAWINLGNTLKTLGRKPEAAAAFLKALSLIEAAAPAPPPGMTSVHLPIITGRNAQKNII